MRPPLAKLGASVVSKLTIRPALLLMLVGALGIAGCGHAKPPPMPAPEYEAPAQPVPSTPTSASRDASPPATPRALPAS